MNGRSTKLSRRHLIELAGLTTGVTLTAAACGSDDSHGGGSGETLTGKDLAAQVESNLPNSKVEFVVKPDYPSVKNSTPGYAKIPDDLKTSISDKPGAGSTFKVISPAWWTTPPSIEKNKYYQAVNDALGATLDFQVTDGNTFGDKIQTLLSSPRSMPDWLVMPSWNIPPRFVEGVGNMFADLTDHLKGDGIKDYPNLARLDPAVWKYCMFNGRIYGLPMPSGNITDAFFYRRDLFEELGLEPPTSADEYLKVAKEATNSSKNRWGSEYTWTGVQLMYGLPPNFREEEGELVHRYETDEFRQAVEFMTELVDQGSVHPDAVAGTGNAKDRFEAGQSLITSDGVGGWHESLARTRPSNPDFDPMAMDFFAPDGGAPTLFRGQPVGTFSFLKKTDDEDRVKEALRIADYCAAQFGTKENFLLTYGEEGTHYKLADDGVPEPTKQGSKEVTTTYAFLAQPMPFNAEVRFPKYVKDAAEWEARQAEHIEDPLFYGIQIQEPAQFGSLSQPMDDLVSDITHGRKKIDELDAGIKAWRNDGGDELRDFYAKFLD